MKIAIVTLTKGASELGNQLCDRIGGTLYCKSEFSNLYAAKSTTKPFKDFVGKVFNEYEGIIFIMATGIVVRSIAPYIESKMSDPAIVVMDEGGQHAISLLSGHLGGGNALTQKVAESIGATAVITTASDVTNNLAVDMFAQKLGASITSMENAKNVTAIGINGGMINIFTSHDLPESVVNKLPKNVRVYIEEESMTEAIQSMHDTLSNTPLLNEPLTNEAGIFISSKHLWIPENCVQLVPRNYVVGIGCRRDSKAEVIKNVFMTACVEAGIRFEAVRQLATIELKADEGGIHELLKDLNIPLEIIALSDIKVVQDRFKGSDFVEKTIGVRAVAEPCAMLAAGQGFMRLSRYADQGVTIAIWEEDDAFKR